MSISKELKEQKELKISKKEQYDFWRSIAFSNDPTVPWNNKLQAFDKLCDLCGTQTEKTQKWIIKMEYA